MLFSIYGQLLKTVELLHNKEKHNMGISILGFNVIHIYLGINSIQYGLLLNIYK